MVAALPLLPLASLHVPIMTLLVVVCVGAEWDGKLGLVVCPVAGFGHGLDFAFP